MIAILVEEMLRESIEIYAVTPAGINISAIMLI